MSAKNLTEIGSLVVYLQLQSARERGNTEEADHLLALLGEENSADEEDFDE